MKKIRLLKKTFPEIEYSENFLTFNVAAISHIVEIPYTRLGLDDDNQTFISIIKFIGSDKEYSVLTEDLEKLSGLKGYRD